MIRERKFLNEIYKNRIEKIPYIEYFQEDSYLRKALFNLIKTQHDFDRQSLHDARPIKLLREISLEIEDFQKIALEPELKLTSGLAGIFSNNLINKLEIIGIPKLKKKFLNDFISNQENINIVAHFVVDELLNIQGNITAERANRNYRELKRVADVLIKNHIDSHEKKELELLSRFGEIGFLDFRQIEKQLRLYNSVSNKLDYLKTIKERYYDKYESLRSGLNGEDSLFYVLNSTTFWESVFGNYTLHTPLRIQTPIFYKHFDKGLEIPEFTFWFLKFNAQETS